MNLLRDLLRPEIIASMLLILVVIIRRPVNPHVSIHIEAPPQKVFSIIDVYDGKQQQHGRSTILMRCIDEVNRVFNFSYSSLTARGQSRSFDAQFRLTQREPGRTIVLEREGFAGKDTSNQLMRMTHLIIPEGSGSRLETTYNWGPRLLISQLLARADLWGGAYRIKGLAETGVANERAYGLISLLMLVVTAALSIITFGVVLGVFTSAKAALLIATGLVFVLFIHEIGHLVAYRMIGQPWGRMVFLPFLGAIAIPRLPFESQWQLLFAALMGPGFSILLAGTCIVLARSGAVPPAYVSPILLTGMVTAIINLFNLIPVEPLDGGVALRSLLARISAKWAWVGLLITGVVVGAIGIYFELAFLLMFAAMAVIFNIKPRKIDVGLAPLTRIHFAIGVSAYLAIGAVYVLMLLHFVQNPKLLQQ